MHTHSLLTVRRLLEDGLQFAHTHDPGHRWQSPWPEAFSWALFATKGAISQTHVDAAGFATRLRIKFGWKIWIVMLEPPLPSAKGWDDHQGLQWQAIVLGPEEDL